MGIAAWVLGIIGGLCAIMGIVTAVDVVPLLNELPAAFTPMFWLTLGVVLLLSCIAAVVSRPGYE